MTRNAYIQIAIKGDNFCCAARESMRLLWANAARASLIAGMGSLFMLIGRLFIVTGTIIISYLLYTQLPEYSEMTTNIYCLIVIFFISATLSMIFMSVYGMSIDTIL